MGLRESSGMCFSNECCLNEDLSWFVLNRSPVKKRTNPARSSADKFDDSVGGDISSANDITVGISLNDIHTNWMRLCSPNSIDYTKKQMNWAGAMNCAQVDTGAPKKVLEVRMSSITLLCSDNPHIARKTASVFRDVCSVKNSRQVIILIWL